MKIKTKHKESGEPRLTAFRLYNSNHPSATVNAIAIRHHQNHEPDIENNDNEDEAPAEETTEAPAN